MEITSVRPNAVSFPSTSTEGVAQEPAALSPGPAASAASTALAVEQAKSESQEKDPNKLAERVSEAVDKLNQTAGIFDRSLRFEIHKESKELMVSVIDSKTDKVIREIPSKEVLDLVAKMKVYVGMVFDKKA
ncbi:MAG: flagellar protein FlaG [Candidatus Ozemobacteraceae bacterium]